MEQYLGLGVGRMERVVINGWDYFWDGDKCPRNAVGLCKSCNMPQYESHAKDCQWVLGNQQLTIPGVFDGV